MLPTCVADRAGMVLSTKLNFCVGLVRTALLMKLIPCRRTWSLTFVIEDISLIARLIPCLISIYDSHFQTPPVQLFFLFWWWFVIFLVIYSGLIIDNMIVWIPSTIISLVKEFFIPQRPCIPLMRGRCLHLVVATFVLNLTKISSLSITRLGCTRLVLLSFLGPSLWGSSP